jgi:hypothetical protein
VRALLDLNVLIALLDQDHVHHDAVSGWLSKNIEFGWATCPITENGCIRIMSLAAYPNCLPPRLICKRLRAATSSVPLQFWGDEVSLLNFGAIDWNQIIGTNQITDATLLALAVSCGGRVVARGSGVPVNAVMGPGSRSVVTI